MTKIRMIGHKNFIHPKSTKLRPYSSFIILTLCLSIDSKENFYATFLNGVLQVYASLCPSPPRAPQVKQRAVTKQNGLFFGAYVSYDFTNPLDFDSHFSTAATVHATIETILLGTSRMVKIFSFLAPS